MWGAVELANVQYITFVLQDRCLVVVDVEIVRSGEKSHDRRETSSPGFAVHTIPNLPNVSATLWH